MLVALFTFVEMAIVLGTFLFVEGNRRFEFADRNVKLVVDDDATLAEALADNADEVLCKILQHHHIRAGPAFKSNQHDCSLFRYVGSTRVPPKTRRPRFALTRQSGTAATALGGHLIEHISTC
jgi:hypothetical protein